MVFQKGNIKKFYAWKNDDRKGRLEASPELLKKVS
jgi:hypothetical protein